MSDDNMNTPPRSTLDLTLIGISHIMENLDNVIDLRSPDGRNTLERIFTIRVILLVQQWLQDANGLQPGMGEHVAPPDDSAEADFVYSLLDQSLNLGHHVVAAPNDTEQQEDAPSAPATEDTSTGE